MSTRSSCPWIFLGLMVLLAGCSSMEHKRSIPAGIRDLHVSIFQNQTREDGLPRILHDKTIQQFLSDGRLNLVSSSRADALLKGTITAYKQIPLVYNDQNVVERYKIRVEIEVRLLDARSGDVLRRWPAIFRETTYSEIIPPTETEFDAQERVLQSLSRDVVTFTVEGWPYLKT